MKPRVLLLLILSMLTILAGSLGGTRVVSAYDSVTEEQPTNSHEANKGKYATNHVIFGSNALKLYTSGRWARYVHPQDSFMLVDGNGKGRIDTNKLNAWAKQVRSRHPKVKIYAAGSGMKNVYRSGGLNRKLFTGMLMIYEPNFPNAPGFKWDRKHSEKKWREAARFIRSKGLKAGVKPSGRALLGRDKAGVWDYGVLGKIMDVNNVQSQGNCLNNSFKKAMNGLVSQYQKAGAKSDLFVQVTVGSNLANGVSPSKAIRCAKVAWSKSRIDRVTLWPQLGGGGPRQAENYLRQREKLLGR